MKKSKFLKVFFMISGFIFLSLAFIGIIVPLLPTTPFLLLSAACFFRSSPKLYLWLTSNKTLGPYIINYREHKAITVKSKIVALVFLWTTLGISGIFAVDSLVMRVLLGLMGTGVTIHLLRFKTLTKEMQNSLQSDRECGSE